MENGEKDINGQWKKHMNGQWKKHMNGKWEKHINGKREKHMNGKQHKHMHNEAIQKQGIGLKNENTMRETRNWGGESFMSLVH